MAKIRANKKMVSYLGPRQRSVSIRVRLMRSGAGYTDQAFRACARISTPQRQFPKSANFEPCAQGNNPREALGRAVSKLGEQIGRHRKGAFEGLKRGRKR